MDGVYPNFERRGSVASGYEGITGQINVEFKKPLLEQPLLMHLNVYGDAFGRAEINSIYTMPLKGIGIIC
ncbi:MAG: hypothetical protein IPJ26_16000 [Bacteroidetes bacterium]|nr:hypothetical protein [Bacteroidota bacterium]